MFKKISPQDIFLAFLIFAFFTSGLLYIGDNVKDIKLLRILVNGSAILTFIFLLLFTYVFFKKDTKKDNKPENIKYIYNAEDKITSIETFSQNNKMTNKILFHADMKIFQVVNYYSHGDVKSRVRYYKSGYVSEIVHYPENINQHESLSRCTWNKVAELC